MKLNHIDLQVSDVQRTALFFERHFGFVPHASRRSPAIVILDDGDGFVLVIQRRQHATDRYPEGFHIGFLVERDEDVVACQRRLRDDGVEVSEVERSSRGTVMYCQAPGDITVEVSCRPAA